MSRRPTLYLICRHVVIGPWLRFRGRPRIIGREHVPRRGAVILAANHLAVSDSFYLTLAARRPVSFLAKSDYFEGRGLRGRLTRRFFAGLGQIAVDRRGGDSARAALDAASAILARGDAWGIHPEGTRSPDGDLHRGHTGVIRVAAGTGAPVVPVAIRGTRRDETARWNRVEVTFLPPMDLSATPTDDPTAIREATDALMNKIAVASGQRYADTYARPPMPDTPQSA
ncbi:lysophospholipid acyltransferase family protein [Gordonia soli]|uniref:Putative acyltransferase n=1 Tax=Gordonia soli NBRC 108243 TaxID=1223545 RepID=M0QQV1_9ACTN|nr:lysophospholipid acyltransferase family protein [Gordonia soli]GAC70774.1 putative acyltransferase [Gordonia soli NBRC 108243]